MLPRWLLLCGSLLIAFELSAQSETPRKTTSTQTESSAPASSSARQTGAAQGDLTARSIPTSPALTPLSATSFPPASATSTSAPSTGSIPSTAPVPPATNASTMTATASPLSSTAQPNPSSAAPPLSSREQSVGATASPTVNARPITTSMSVATRGDPSPSVDAQVVPDPRAGTPEKLQRSGSLLSQPLPSGAGLAQSSDQESSLPPLRQILVPAPDLKTAEQQRQLLLEKGIRIGARKNLAALGLVVSTFNLPDDIDVDALLVQLGSDMAGVNIEKNQRFRLLSSDMKSYAQTLVGLTLPSPCQQPVTLAMIDSAVNTELPGFSSGRVRFHNMVSSSRIDLSSPLMKHGTAIASLLVSADSNFPGILPSASLDAINVFVLDQAGRAETRTDWLLAGLNKVAELSPAPLALNLSFGGNYSPLLDKAFAQLAKSMVLVAAGGNSGTSQLVYPAAYDSVYGVAAVDARGNKTTQSNFGDYISLRAPGEDIWTQSHQGKGFYAGGTSFATPFATAALALAAAADVSIDQYLLSLGESKMVNYRGLCHSL